jgi:hypothetical protein
VAKKNQKLLMNRIISLINSPTLYQLEFGTACQQEKGHGRLEKRSIQCCAIPRNYTRFPYATHAFCLTREVKNIKTGHISFEKVYGLTSLPLSLPVEGDAFTNQRIGLRRLAVSLLSFVRGHWTIENKSHYVRDVTWQEDSCRCHEGNLPQVLACFRNVAMNLMRVLGCVCIASATRMFAARPDLAIDLIKREKTE